MELQRNADGGSTAPPKAVGGALVPRPGRRARWVWLAAWIALTALVVYLRPFDFRAVGRGLATAQPGWVLLAAIANLCVVPLLATLWSQLLPAARSVRWRVLGECAALAFAGMNTLPLAGGQALAVGLLATRASLGLDGSLSLMALEQLCEGGAKLGLLLLALAVAPLSENWRRTAWWLGAGLVAAAAALMWLARAAPENRPGGWRARWSRHLDVLRRPRIFLGAFALALAMKVVELVAIYAVQRALGMELPLASVAVVLAAVAFATLVSIAPGNLGVYEAAAFAAYRWFGVPTDQALALALVHHACFLAPMLVPGYALMAWRALAPAKPA
ncbi:MAG TPA: lysylphosphatidylglycerol synthase transmembrane domain-containing protein [Opitutaceae bacterium]|nr:lysylphosphatidylglycerol synthase transmembrane domain-containing protein [Opitutaceae bacterium]